MKSRYFFLQTFALVVAIAFALALLIATLGAVAATAAKAMEQPAGTELGGTALERPIEAPQTIPAQATAPSAQPQTSQGAEESFEGMVTCSRCQGRHSAQLGKSAADCTRICVHQGAKFALIDGEKTYFLDGDLNLLKRLAGQRASIVGTATGNTIRVSSVLPGS